MKAIENHCVDCGLPCLGKSCPYIDVLVYYCDDCGEDGATYRIDGNDCCEECAKSRIEEAWNDLTLSEKAELLNISFSEICD